MYLFENSINTIATTPCRLLFVIPGLIVLIMLNHGTNSLRATIRRMIINKNEFTRNAMDSIKSSECWFNPLYLVVKHTNDR